VKIFDSEIEKEKSRSLALEESLKEKENSWSNLEEKLKKEAGQHKQRYTGNNNKVFGITFFTRCNVLEVQSHLSCRCLEEESKQRRSIELEILRSQVRSLSLHQLRALFHISCFTRTFSNELVLST